jgi:hypothetical protein
MRKIEQEMLAAVWNMYDLAKDNTQVIRDGESTRVYLHGHEIAEVSNYGVVYVNAQTLIEYPTRTTCSRLRALGVPVSVRQGEPLLDGVPVGNENLLHRLKW